MVDSDRRDNTNKAKNSDGNQVAKKYCTERRKGLDDRIIKLDKRTRDQRTMNEGSTDVGKK